MKAVDLNEDTLEDLLTYDDLFLDYFNAFLQLPAFAEPLEYDRLVGTFQEVVTQVPQAQSSPHPPTSALSRSALGSRSEKRYGVSDEERESMLEWCKNNRLPYFLETTLFRELKLLKLLLRTLEERFQSSASHRSSQIRGYSRQTESYVSSLSNSADNSANEDDYDEEWSGDSSGRYGPVDQPGSRAVSLPAQLGHARSAKSEKGKIAKRQQTGRQVNRTKKVLFSNRKESTDPSQESGGAKEGSAVTRQATFRSVEEQENIAQVLYADRALKPPRSISAPVNYKEFLHIPMYTDFTDIFLNDGIEGALDEQKFVSYNEDKASEQQTESDMKNLEGKFNMSLQQMKERIFSSRAGLEEFKDFLSDTNGKDLFNFWLDCETFKDTMADHDEIMKMASRNQLFRDIQDKYKLSLTADAKAQIQKAASSYQLSHTVFIRTQYDVLRRLRTYWLPRFILHKEKANELNTLLGLHQLGIPGQLAAQTKIDKFSDHFLPKISFVNSLPIDHNRILQLAAYGEENWTRVSQGGRKFDARVKSGGFFRPVQLTATADLKEKMLHALQTDRNAGGPFRAYLSKFEKCTLLSKLLFWEAVTDYGDAEDRSADRLLRMNQAWNIYSVYIADCSPRDIDLDVKNREVILQSLQMSTDFVSADILESAKSCAIDSLVEPWKLYLKYDVKLFLDAQAARFGEEEMRPNFPLERIHIICEVDSSRILISKPLMRIRSLYRKRPPTSSTVTTLVIKRTPLTQSAREERRQLRIERRKQQAREQKALLKAVKARQEERKQRIVSGESDLAEANNAPNNPLDNPLDNPPKDLNAKSRQSGELAIGPDGEPIEGDEFGGSLFPHSGKSRKSVYSRDSPTKDERKSARINAALHEKEVEFVEMVKSRQMMTMFKKYLLENDSKDMINAVNFYIEIDNYHKTESKPKTKKDLQAAFIYKTFMENGGKKFVKLNSEKIKNRLNTEKERPKSATLNEAQKSLVVLINPMFQQFFESLDERRLKAVRADLAKLRRKTQAEEFGVEPKVLATMSQAELAMRAETDAGLGKGKKGGRQRRDDGEADDGGSVASDHAAVVKQRKKKQTGRAPPSKDDKLSLMHALQESLLNGKPTVQMDYFWKYLIKHGEEDNSPLIDKDLMFYLEVQKYKELTHNFTDEELVKRKCQAIVDCFLESAIQPPCQIDISSEMCNRIIKNAVKVMQGKEIITNLFDEAQFIVFKELLPYWAGFMKSYKPPDDPRKPAVSKRQKTLQKRYEDFQNSQPPTEQRLSLPVIKTGPLQSLKVSSFTYSITDGLKVKEPDSEDSIPQSNSKMEEEESDAVKSKAHQLKALNKARKASVISSLHSGSKNDIPTTV